MKSLFASATVLITAGFAAFLGATPARAETLMKADIPFAFIAGEQTHAAGAYEVRVNRVSKYVELRPLGSPYVERVPLNGAFDPRVDKSSTDGFLQFHQYGDRFALRSVGTPGATEGLEVIVSKAEKELTKSTGGSSSRIITIR